LTHCDQNNPTGHSILDYRYEKNIPAQRPETETHPWLPLAYVNQGRASHTEPSPRQRSQAPRCLGILLRVGSPRSDTRFDKSRRLLNATDYSRVFDNAEAKASGKHLLLLARRNTLGSHRLGLVIAKKNVRLAVERNRIKRIAREFFRHLPENEATMDVVLLARRGIDELDNRQLSSILQQQWHRLERHISEHETRRDH